MIKNEIEFILDDKLIKIKDIDTNVTVLNYLRINRKLKPGRIRMNCTAKDNEGWRWFGYQFIMPNYLD